MYDEFYSTKVEAQLTFLTLLIPIATPIVCRRPRNPTTVAWASVEVILAVAIIVTHGGLIHESLLRPILEILFHSLRLRSDALRPGSFREVLFNAAWDTAHPSLLVGKGGGSNG